MAASNHQVPPPLSSRRQSCLTPDTTIDLATQGQEKEEVATSPTPGLAPSSKIAPNKSIGGSWRPMSAFKQSRFLHSSPQMYKEDLGDREEQDMPAAGIATSGPGTGSSNTGDAGGSISTC